MKQGMERYYRKKKEKEEQAVEQTPSNQTQKQNQTAQNQKKQKKQKNQKDKNFIRPDEPTVEQVLAMWTVIIEAGNGQSQAVMG